MLSKPLSAPARRRPTQKATVRVALALLLIAISHFAIALYYLQ